MLRPTMWLHVFSCVMIATILQAQAMRSKHQCLVSSVPLFTLECESGQSLHIHSAMRGYSKEAIPGSSTICPYSSPECTMSAMESNVIKQCQHQQKCTMKASAAIGAALWDSSCIGHAVIANFIEVNYTCRPVPSETAPDDMTTKATGSRVDQSQTHSFSTVPVPRDTTTIGTTTVHAVINKTMEQPAESMLGTRGSVWLALGLVPFFILLIVVIVIVIVLRRRRCPAEESTNETKTKSPVNAVVENDYDTVSELDPGYDTLKNVSCVNNVKPIDNPAYGMMNENTDDTDPCYKTWEENSDYDIIDETVLRNSAPQPADVPDYATLDEAAMLTDSFRKNSPRSVCIEMAEEDTTDNMPDYSTINKAAKCKADPTDDYDNVTADTRDNADKNTTMPTESILPDDGTEKNTTMPTASVPPQDVAKETKTMPTDPIPPQDDGEETTTMPTDSILPQDDGEETTAMPTVSVLPHDVAEETTIMPTGSILPQDDGEETTAMPTESIPPQDDREETTAMPNESVLHQDVAEETTTMPTDLIPPQDVA